MKDIPSILDTPSLPRLTLLHVCSIKGRGGTGYMAGHLCSLLRKSGHHVLIGACEGSKIAERVQCWESEKKESPFCSPSRGNSSPSSSTYAEGRCELLPPLSLLRGFHPLALTRDIGILRKWIRERQVAIVHTWHSIETWTCALATLGTSAVLCRTRGLVTPVRPHPFNRWLHARTGALFVTCRKIEMLYREAGFPMDNVFLLRDGVDTERFRPGRDPKEVRRLLGLPVEGFFLASIGRLEPVKDPATLLYALSHLPSDVHAIFAGDGSLRNELESLAQLLGVRSRTHFLGVRKDIETVLAASDGYVLCSIGSEGSSRATLEAMATGLPCVTTDVGMLPDIIHDGETGYLFPPKKSEILVERIQRLRSDPDLRKRLAIAAHRWVTEYHSEAAMVSSVEAGYAAALRSRRAFLTC